MNCRLCSARPATPIQSQRTPIPPDSLTTRPDRSARPPRTQRRGFAIPGQSKRRIFHSHAPTAPPTLRLCDRHARHAVPRPLLRHSHRRHARHDGELTDSTSQVCSDYTDETYYASVALVVRHICLSARPAAEATPSPPLSGGAAGGTHPLAIFYKSATLRTVVRTRVPFKFLNISWPLPSRSLRSLSSLKEW